MSPVQMHVTLLILTWTVSCLATEKKPFYENLYDPKNIFQVEDHHADLVLGMLPTIKTSIKDFRKKNYSRHDIENMYQTLTIFWPVVRSYLRLTEELVGNKSSKENNRYEDISNNSVSEDESNFDKFDDKIAIKDEIEFKNMQNFSENGPSRFLQTSSLPNKGDQKASAQIKSDTISSSNIQATISNPLVSISKFSENRQNSAPFFKHRFGVKEGSIRTSVSNNDNRRKIQSKYPNRNVQNREIIGQVATTTERTFRPTIQRKYPNRNVQSKETFSQLTATTERTFRSIQSKDPIRNVQSKEKISQLYATTEITSRPINNTPPPTTTRNPSKIIHFDQLSTLNDRTFKSRSRKPLSVIASRLLRPTSRPPVTGNISNLAVKAGTLVSTTIDRPTPASRSRTTLRSNPSSLTNSKARNAPKVTWASIVNQTKQVDSSSQDRSTLENESSDTSPAESIFFFRGTQDLSRLLKVIGKPIDLSDIDG